MTVHTFQLLSISEFSSRAGSETLNSLQEEPNSARETGRVAGAGLAGGCAGGASVGCGICEVPGWAGSEALSLVVEGSRLAGEALLFTWAAAGCANHITNFAT